MSGASRCVKIPGVFAVLQGDGLMHITSISPVGTALEEADAKSKTPSYHQTYSKIKTVPNRCKRMLYELINIHILVQKQCQ